MYFKADEASFHEGEINNQPLRIGVGESCVGGEFVFPLISGIYVYISISGYMSNTLSFYEQAKLSKCIFQLLFTM